MKKIIFILTLIFAANFVWAEQSPLSLKHATPNNPPKVAFNLNFRQAKQNTTDYIKNITSQLFDFSTLSWDLTNINSIKTDFENKINQNRKDFYSKYPDIKLYLKADLTTWDKQNIKNIVQTQVNNIKDLYQKAEGQKNQGTYNNDDFLSKLEEIENTYFESIRQYIDADKITDFGNYAVAFVDTVKTNHNLRQDMLQKISEIKDKMVSRISASFKDKIWKIWDLILNKDKRKAFFLKILDALKSRKDNILKTIKNNNFAQNLKLEILNSFEKITKEYVENIK